MSEDTVVDRGDVLDDDKIPPSTIDDSKPESEEAAAAEELAENAAARGDEEGEEGEERPRDAQGKFTKKDRPVPDHVPKARMDEAVTRERAAREAAEARAAELAARLKQEEKSVDVQKMEEQVEALEKKHAEYLLDGEKEKAAEVMKQIRHAERNIARMESSEESSKATERAVEQVRMEAAIAKLEADYPVFNPESEGYDQDMIDIVLAEQARLIQTQRMLPSKALLQAATKIMAKFAPVAADKEGAKGLAAAKGSDRKAEQVAKNLDTAKRQPASMKAGKDSDKAGENLPNIADLTPSEFAALPETTKAKLRGDFL